LPTENEYKEWKTNYQPKKNQVMANMALRVKEKGHLREYKTSADVYVEFPEMRDKRKNLAIKFVIIGLVGQIAQVLVSHVFSIMVPS